MTERVVLAYSGGLDTSVASAGSPPRPAPRSSRSPPTSARAARTWTSSASGHWTAARSRPSSSTPRTSSPTSTACPRCRPTPSTWSATRWSPRCRGRSSSSTCRGGPVPRRHHGRPRLHRQGQRPGPVRGRHRRARPGPQGARPGPRLRHDPRQGDRLRRGEGLPIDVNKRSPYSIDQNVWGRAVETGFLEDIWNAPIEDIYSYTQNPAEPRDADEVVITFDRACRSPSTARPSPCSSRSPS